MASTSSSNPALVMELDVIFPRWAVYAPSDILPIAVTVNDFYGVHPNFSAVSWEITGPDDGPEVSFPPPFVDAGRFTVLETTTVSAAPEEASLSPLAPSSYESTVLVAYTNVSAWKKQYHAADQLDLSIMTADNSLAVSISGGSTAADDGGWTGVLPIGCGTAADAPAFLQVGTSFGSIPFAVESDAKIAAANSSILQPLAADAPGCPAAGGAWLVGSLYVNASTKALCFEDYMDEDEIAYFDTVSCTDRATIPAAVRTSIDSAATSLARAANGGGGGSAQTTATTTSSGSSATGKASGTGTSTGTGSTSKGSPSSTAPATTNSAGNRLPSLRRVLTAMGVVSLASYFVC